MFKTNNIFYIGLLIILFAIFLYQRYLDKIENDRILSVYDINNGQGLESLLLYLSRNEGIIEGNTNNRKPILWVHVPYEYNSRSWYSFYSRSSYELNQPYLYMTAKSIIKQCENSFHICFIDDNSFARLLPKNSWNVDMTQIADPVLCKMRMLGMAKLLYYYGGLQVPLSFLCNRDLIDMYNCDQDFIIAENYNTTSIQSSTSPFNLDPHFIGAKQYSESAKNYVDYLSHLISNDQSAQSIFTGRITDWIKENCKNIKVINAYQIGAKTVAGEPITLDMLLSENYIDFYPNMFGICIPDKMILKRNSYQWFAYLEPKSIMESNFILAKHMLASLGNTLTMSGKNGYVSSSSVTHTNPKSWISFWKVPLTHGTLNVWGMMPQGIGNNVPKRKYSGGNIP